MDLCPFGSLSDARAAQPFTTVDMNHIMVHCLRAPDYLHSQKVSHRDIKPGNILVSLREPSIHALLTDFGLSKEGSEFASVVGTLGYFAPELLNISEPSEDRHEAVEPPQMRRKTSGDGLTNAVDMWSPGVVALWLSNAVPGYVHESDKRRRAWFDSLVQAASGLRDEGQGKLAKQMLVIDPKKRISCRQCLDLALVEGLNGEGAADLPGSPRAASPHVSLATGVVTSDITSSAPVVAYYGRGVGAPLPPPPPPATAQAVAAAQWGSGISGPAAPATARVGERSTQVLSLGSEKLGGAGGAASAKPRTSGLLRATSQVLSLSEMDNSLFC
jgi:serine/threonine protein kinase